MYCLIEVFKSKLLHYTNEDCEKILHDYLTNIETWTHYEMYYLIIVCLYFLLNSLM